MYIIYFVQVLLSELFGLSQMPESKGWKLWTMQLFQKSLSINVFEFMGREMG